MKIFCLTLLTVLFFSCKPGSENTQEDTGQSTEYTIHAYKVVGLNDSIISDSVWKIIFSVEGIEELILNKKDSLVIAKVDKELVDKGNLEKEIERRGATILAEVD